MLISDRIREISQREYGGNVAEMARSTGIPSKTLYKYLSEENPVNPGAEALQKLAEIGISVDWILTGNGSMRGVQRGAVNVQRIHDLTKHMRSLLEQIESELNHPTDADVLADRLGRQVLQRRGEPVPPIDERTGLTDTKI